MKTKLFTLAALALLVFGCEEKQETALVPKILDGSYNGRVTYVFRTTLDRPDSLPKALEHSIAFQLDADKFYRPECGCNGALAVDPQAQTAHLTSFDKACQDSGTSDYGQSGWSYTNDMIGQFSYQINADSLTLIHTYSSTDPVKGSPVYSQKIIVGKRSGI